MKQHVKFLGWLYIVFSVIGIFLALLLFGVMTGAGMITRDREAAAVLAILGPIFGIFFAVMSLPGLLGGIYLLKYANWARILLIVVGILNLLNFPFGTAVGVYTLWVLLNNETVALFNSGGVTQTVSQSGTV